MCTIGAWLAIAWALRPWVPTLSDAEATRVLRAFRLLMGEAEFRAALREIGLRPVEAAPGREVWADLRLGQYVHLQDGEVRKFTT